jgi:hypothetical protein
MWFQSASRKQLAELLERPGISANLFDGSEVLPEAPLQNDEFVLIWPERPGNQNRQPPTALIVPDTQRHDLLAWTASFKSSYRPFTAFVRVINFRTCRALIDRSRTPFAVRGAAAAVGAILGEALASAGQSSDLTLNECARTYAYAMGRAYALGLSELLEEVTLAWQTFASITNAPTDRRREMERQRRPWLALAEATEETTPSPWHRSVAGSSNDINSIRLLKDLYATGAASEQSLHRFQQRWPGFESLLPMLRESREIRVQAFQRFAQDLPEIAKAQGDAEEMALVLGYLASRLAPGSLEYFRLLRQLEVHLPGLLVWYGICAALQNEDFVGNAGSLGRRLYRDLIALPSFPEAPRADISVWDLEVFGRSEANPLSFLGGAPFRVELVPDVVCVASGRGAPASQGQLPESDAVRQALRQAELSMTPYELRSLLDELRQALGRVANVQYKIERMVGDSGSTRSQSKGRTRK